MGMRIKVAVGYGLDLSSLNKTFISEYDNMESQELFKAFTADALAGATARDDISDKTTIGLGLGTGFHIAKHPPTDLNDMVEWDEEFAFEDKMLLFPVGYKKNWYRSSDMLDAFIYEAHMDRDNWDGMAIAWKEKPGTLYPFVGLMRANHAMPLGVETYWENCYLGSEKHKNATPVAPLHLWYLIKHLRLTETDEQTTAAFLSLRPHFMRWWS